MRLVPVMPIPEELAVAFDDFWTLYPRKEAKKDARKSWDHMSGPDRFDAIVAACSWRRVWAAQGRDTTRIPMPATWLNGERWTDELPSEHSHASHVPAKPVETERTEMPQSVRDAIARLRK